MINICLCDNNNIWKDVNKCWKRRRNNNNNSLDPEGMIKVKNKNYEQTPLNIDDLCATEIN